MVSSKTADMEAEDCLKPGLGVKRHHFYYILLLRADYKFRAGLWVEKWIFTFDERNSEVTLRKNMHTDMGGDLLGHLCRQYILQVL